MNITERKEKEKAERRKEILNAAREVFFRLGFEHTSMEKVAETATLAKGTLYLYFKSKDELYISLVEEGTQLLNEMMKSAIDSEVDVLDKLKATARAYFHFTDKHRDYWRIFMMMDMGAMESKVDAEKLQQFREMRRASISTIENLILEAQAKGLLRSDVSSKDLMLMLWAATLGAVIMSVEKCSKLDMTLDLPPETFVTEVANMLLDGMSNKMETNK
ncbi:MAG: TetR/AcrR family transcriptional regulator [Chloroherpetonaceae bacterium]|nr:TetR/AcrR family transcriptional regulator [Chloroherpetonaceae bacterium]